MENRQETFLSLLRNSLTGSEKQIDLADFTEMEKIARNQLCLSLIYDGVIKAKLTPPACWKNHLLQVVAGNFKNLSVQAELINRLNENNIRCAVLKGISVSRFYPEPLYRALGDIDILVDEDNYDKAIDILTGTTERSEENCEHKFHYGFSYQGISVEVHKYMTEYTDDEYGKFLNNYLRDSLNNIEIAKYDTFSFPVLEPKFLIISLVLHTQRHFFEHKTTMRMICDFAMAVNNIDTEIWEKQVYPSITDLKLEFFTCALLELLQKYLGINCSDKIKIKVDEKIIDNLLLEFLQDGIEPEYTDINSISKIERIKSLFGTITGIVKRDFKIIKKAPILWPMFFVYVPIRSILRKLAGRRKNIGVIGYGVSFNRRTEICKELKLRD